MPVYCGFFYPPAPRATSVYKHNWIKMSVLLHSCSLRKRSVGLTGSCCEYHVSFHCTPLLSQSSLLRAQMGRGGSSAVGLHGNRDGFFGLLAGVLFAVWHCANTEIRIWKLWLGAECLALLCWKLGWLGITVWGGGNFQLFGVFRIYLLGPLRISSLIIMHGCLKGTPLSFLYGLWFFKREIALLQNICCFLLFRIAQRNSPP